MTDKERLDWIERTGANVVGVTSETLIPDSFSVCVRGITGWATASTVREAIDKAEAEAKHMMKAIQ